MSLRKSHHIIAACLFAFLLSGITVVCLFVSSLSDRVTQQAHAGAYIFAGETYGINIITHPMGYNGTGGNLTISVAIDPTSAHASKMATPVQNIICTFNSLTPTTGNLVFGASNNIPTNYVDFESVVFHELGHSLGLAHPNLATESGLSGNDQDYTKSTDGTNNMFDIATGLDGVRGSSDDDRGDDVNLHWFRRVNNNPFTIASTVDSTTYSRYTTNLPTGHSFAANADRTVGTLLGVSNTEAVMQQGTYIDEAQRTLNHDDVATLRLAMAGLDESAGTADDYTFTLTYAGLTTIANIVIDFDNSQTGFAVSQSSGVFLNSSHVVITSTKIYLNDGFNWFFNTVTTCPSGNTLCGSISGTLTAVNSPYTVTCDIQVDAGQSLVIESGVVLNRLDNYTFTVNGQLTWYP